MKAYLRDTTLDEVEDLTEDRAEALGMEIVEATFDQLKKE